LDPFIGGKIVRDVIKGAIQATEEIGADVGLVANRAVSGIIEATRNIGGNVGDVGKAAVEGALEEPIKSDARL
jgi:hypothetical protein